MTAKFKRLMGMKAPMEGKHIHGVANFLISKFVCTF
jgi:hypothetical protein